jgi:branched-chain amino acid transport system substrate-binding protein
MRLRRGALLGVALVLGLSGCERAEERASDTGATTLTVYASLPLQGAAGPESEAIANGARLALEEAGGKAGELVVKLVVLDDSTPSSGRWDPEQAAENARTVVRDRTAIAYLGDGPSGATAVSLPILNSGGVLQVSPTSAYAGLTGTLDADKGEPDKYYPSGRRTFARPVPGDDVQALAVTAALEDEGCRRVMVLDDRDVAGRGLSVGVERTAVAEGIEVVGTEGLRPGFDVQAEARGVAEGEADCVVVAAALADWVPEFFDALHAADPQLELFGGSDLASDGFAGSLARGTQARTHLTSPPGVLEPLPAVRDFDRRYREAFRLPPRTGAIYGHEAMGLVLAAIEGAGAKGNDRTAVTRALFSLGERRGPFGAYRIDRRGNTTSRRYSRLSVRGGRVVGPETVTYPPG